MKNKFQTTFILSLLLFVVAEAGLLKLAYWQYNRAQQKEMIRLKAEKQTNQPLQKRALTEENAGYVTTITGMFDNTRNSVLEHQLFGAQTGWRLFTPLMIKGQKEILIDRGWIAYPEGDARLHPNLSLYANTQVVHLKGVIKAFPKRKGLFKGPTYSVNKQVMLFLASDGVPQIENVTRAPVYMQSAVQTHPFVNAFVAIPKSGSRHIQYMYTWLALAFLIACSYGAAVFMKRA